jgi:predicted nucleic acid-binding protein
MTVLVDTPIWSEFLRRVKPEIRIQDALQRLVEQEEAILIGPVRQEVLAGISDQTRYERLRSELRAFPNAGLLSEDYERAAWMFTECRTQGIQGSNTDFLICAVSARLNAPIFTLDRGFDRYAAILNVDLYHA